MLLLSKLDEVRNRFPGYVEEMRDFLVEHGLAVDSAEVLPALCSRLGADRPFCRDVSSMVWAVAVQEAEEASSMDLLGILVVASAGTKVNVQTERQVAAVRELLRFVMHARRAAPRSAPVTTSARVRPDSLDTSLPVLADRERASAAVPATEKEARGSDSQLHRIQNEFSVGLAGLDEVEESPWWRSPVIVWVGMVALCLGLGALWLIRRESAAVKRADATPTALEAGKTAGTTGSPALPQGGITRVIVRAHRTVASRKMLAARKTSRRISRPSSRVSSEALPRSMSAADAKAAPVLRIPAAPASTTVELPVNKETSVGARASASKASTQPIDPYAVPPLLRRGTGGQPDEVASEPEERTTPEGGVVRPQSTGMMAANVYYSPAPLYPPAASAAGVQGEVTVRATVDAEGNVTDARVVSGPEPLRDAALEAVQHWRYRPYTQNGKQIAVQTTAVVDFQLPD